MTSNGECLPVSEREALDQLVDVLPSVEKKKWQNEPCRHERGVSTVLYVTVVLPVPSSFGHFWLNDLNVRQFIVT